MGQRNERKGKGDHGAVSLDDFSSEILFDIKPG